MKHALDLAAQILDALAHAHSRGLAHRRVRPSNVLVTPDGRVKVKGFGLPHQPEADSSASRPYLSPEQIATGQSDARGDVFAFGVVCYRMLTGVLPFAEDSVGTVVRALRTLEPPAPLEKYCTGVPPRLGKLVLRCLARDPLERFADAGELKKALSSIDGPAPAIENVAVPASLPPARATTRPSVAPPPRAPEPASKPRVEAEAAIAPAKAPRAPVPVKAKGHALRPRPSQSPDRSPEPPAEKSEKSRTAAPRARTRRWIWAFAAATLIAVVGAGAAWTFHRSKGASVERAAPGSGGGRQGDARPPVTTLRSESGSAPRGAERRGALR
jgi:serine/threonine-protein kinase